MSHESVKYQEKIKFNQGKDDLDIPDIFYGFYRNIIAISLFNHEAHIYCNSCNGENNLEEVETFVNQMLQGKPKTSINDLTRFVINTTIGLGGFIDVASKIGLQRHEEDFGQTLAVWGVGQGPYIMLPVLGPSTLRDTFGRPVSSYLSVTFHMTETDVNIALKGIDAIETREKLLGIETLLSGDKYSFVKDAYIQSMYYEIKDGIDVEDEFIDDMDDFLIDE